MMQTNSFKIFALTLFMFITFGFLRVHAEPEIAKPYAKDVEYLNDVIKQQRDYIDLRTKSFDTMNKLESNTISNMSYELSSVSTDLNQVQTRLDAINDENYFDTLAQAKTNLNDINLRLIDINKQHKETAKQGIIKIYVEKQKTTLSKMFTILQENKNVIENYSEIATEMDGLDDQMSKVENEFSEGEWGKLETEIENFVDTTKDLAGKIKLQIDS